MEKKSLLRSSESLIEPWEIYDPLLINVPIERPSRFVQLLPPLPRRDFLHCDFQSSPILVEWQTPLLYFAKTKAKATCVQTAIPIIPRPSIKSLTIGLPREGEGERKSRIRSIRWKSTPNYRDTSFPPRKHRRWNHESGNRWNIPTRQSGQALSSICQIRFRETTLWKLQFSIINDRINVAFDRFFKFHF